MTKSAAVPSCGHAVAAAFRAIWPELLLIRKCRWYERECRTHLPAWASAGHDLRALGPIRPCASNATQPARPIGPVGPTLYNSAYEARTPSSKDSAWTELNSKERPGNVGIVHEPVRHAELAARGPGWRPALPLRRYLQYSRHVQHNWNA